MKKDSLWQSPFWASSCLLYTSRDSRSLEDDDILIVFRHGKGASDGVLHLDVSDFFRRKIVIAGGLESYDVRLARLYIFFDLLIGKISALFRIFSVDAGSFLGGFLSASDLCQLVLRQEARISQPLLYTTLDEALVYLASVALEIRSVIAL